MIAVRRYEQSHRHLWDEAVSKSDSAPFFLKRNFQDYHGDRFQDFSLLVFEGSELVAILPANVEDSGARVVSHAGLTFGGLHTVSFVKTPKYLAIFEAMLGFLRDAQVSEFSYKAVPSYYREKPSESDLFAAFQFGGKLVRRELSSVVPQGKDVGYSARRVRAIKKGQKSGVEVSESEDFGEFWKLLTTVLRERHGAEPVHSLAEIQKLHSLFPDNIRLFHAKLDGALVAGTTVFENPSVAHAQYLAADTKGRSHGALDLLLDHLFRDKFSEKEWFSLGTSNDRESHALNEGLITQKEEFGAGSFVHDEYLFDLSQSGTA